MFESFKDFKRLNENKEIKLKTKGSDIDSVEQNPQGLTFKFRSSVPKHIEEELELELTNEEAQELANVLKKLGF